MALLEETIIDTPEASAAKFGRSHSTLPETRTACNSLLQWLTFSCDCFNKGAAADFGLRIVAAGNPEKDG